MFFRKFDNTILIIGNGSVSQSFKCLLFKHIDVAYKNVTIIDCCYNKNLEPWIKLGVNFMLINITKNNYEKILSTTTKDGGLVIDLSFGIETSAMIKWCMHNNRMYLSTALETWEETETDVDPKTEDEKVSLMKKITLSYQHKKIYDLQKELSEYKTTCLINMGANPGLISLFVKRGLIDFAKHLNLKYVENDFNLLSKQLEIETIHISEIDTQISSISKPIDEFVNTWSIEAFHEEGFSYSEINFGSHEKNIPKGIKPYNIEFPNIYFLKQFGFNNVMCSYVPDEQYHGLVITHSEVIELGNYLSSKNYSPTIQFIYSPCPDAWNSLREIKPKNYKLPSKKRILMDDIISGSERMGCLLMSKSYGAFWTGSILDINQVRDIMPKGSNCTVMQVAAGVLAGVCWMLGNKNMGICQPCDLDQEYVLKIAKLYLGDFISMPVKWTPLRDRINWYHEEDKPDKEDIWQFKNFFINQ